MPLVKGLSLEQAKAEARTYLRDFTEIKLYKRVGDSLEKVADIEVAEKRKEIVHHVDSPSQLALAH